MPSINPYRMTHRYDGDLVLFLIGMRINKPWRPDMWLPVPRDARNAQRTGARSGVGIPRLAIGL